MITWQLALTFGLVLVGNTQASSKISNKPNFLRQLQTECDCSDYTDDVCLGYDYNGEGGSALPSNFAECGEACCNCSCSAVTVELCVACLDAGACNSFLTSCAEECCILVSSSPAAAPQKWGGWGGSSGSWSGSSGGGGAKPPSKPKPAPKPKGGKYKSGGGAKKGKKSKYSSGGGSGSSGYSSSWSGSNSSWGGSHSEGYVEGGDGRVSGVDQGERVDAGGSDARTEAGTEVGTTTNSGSTGRVEGTEPEPEAFARSSSSASAASASVSSTAAESSMMTNKIFGMSRTVFFCASLLAISAVVAFVVGLTQRNTAKEGIDAPLQEMPGLHVADTQFVRSA